MNLLAILLAVVLALIGLLHFAWAMGSTWPRTDERTLARTVVGSRGIEKMPPRWASLLVALCLFGAAYWALAIRWIVTPLFSQVILFLGGAALAAVFGLRGLFGLMPAFEKMSPEQPFLSLNRKYYSPLCLLIGATFALLVIAMPNWGWRLG